MLFAVLFLFLLLVSGACSFSLSSLLKKEVPLDTQRVCAALYKLPKVPDNNLFREARLLAESSAVCRKSHFWVWERMNPMEIADLIATDLRVQDFIGRVREEHARVEKEREKAYAEKRDLKMVQLYKRRHQQRFKCIAAALWTHDSRSQSLPTLQKNPLPDMPERISSWMKPVRISFERNDSHQVDSLPRWCVLVYITYVLLGLKKFGFLSLNMIMAIVRSIMSINLREKSIQLLERYLHFVRELFDFDFISALILRMIRLTVILCMYLLATTIGTIRVVYLYAHRDDTSLRMEFYEVIIALYTLFVLLTFVLIGDSQNDVVGHAIYYLGNLVFGYVWFEYIMKSYWEWMDSLFGKPKIKSRKEKAKKPKINSSPLNAYWIHMLVDLEKAARLMVSRHLNAVWKELFQLQRWYKTPFIRMCITALFAFVIFGNISFHNRISVCVGIFVTFIPGMLVRELFHDTSKEALEQPP
jgi:hypothetical protein